MTDYEDLAEEAVPGHPDGLAPTEHEAGADPAEHAYAGDLTDPVAVAPFIGRRVNAPDEKQDGNGILAGVDRDGDEVRLTFDDGRTLHVVPQERLVFERD